MVELHDLQVSLPYHDFSFLMPPWSFNPEGCNTPWMEKVCYHLFLTLVYRGGLTWSEGFEIEDLGTSCQQGYQHIGLKVLHHAD